MAGSDACNEGNGDAQSSPWGKAGKNLNVNFSIALRIWDQLPLAARTNQDGVSIGDLTDIWIAASNAERLDQGRRKLTHDDKQVINASMNVVVRDIGVDSSGNLDACEWLHQILIRYSGSSVGWAIAQLSGLMREAGDQRPECFQDLHNFLKAEEDDNVGHLRLKSLLLFFCDFVWKELGILKARAFLSSLKSRQEPEDVASTRRSSTDLRAVPSPRQSEDVAHETAKALNLDDNRLVPCSMFMVCCLGRPRRAVFLHQYDITGGGAKVMSLQHLEGVWHTGLVIYGREYFFNGQLVFKDPGGTSFGTPTKVCQMGHTYRRKEELHLWVVEELKPLFTRANYDLLENNCNHFTNRIAFWLTGNHLPDEVMGQADSIKQMPVLMQMLKPVFRVAAECTGINMSSCHSCTTEGESFGCLVAACSKTGHVPQEHHIPQEHHPEGPVCCGDLRENGQASKLVMEKLMREGYKGSAPQIVKVAL